MSNITYNGLKKVDTSSPVPITRANGDVVMAYPVGYNVPDVSGIRTKVSYEDLGGGLPVTINKSDGTPITAYPTGSLPEPEQSKTVTPQDRYSYDVPKPVYESKYSGEVADLLDAIAGHKPFSYDVESDPLYSQYRKQYLREGKRATEDVMGSFAGMTGGIPSSYAVTAAAEAGNYYNSQLNDRVPELYQLAYDRYRNEYDDMYKKLNMYLTADDLAYGRYRDSLGDWYDDRKYDRDVFENDRDYQTNINKYSDELARDDRDFQYKVNVYSDEKAANERAKALEKAIIDAEYHDYSGLEELGVNTSFVRAKQHIAEAVDSKKALAEYYLNGTLSGEDILLIASELGIDISDWA